MYLTIQSFSSGYFLPDTVDDEPGPHTTRLGCIGHSILRSARAVRASLGSCSMIFHVPTSHDSHYRVLATAFRYADKTREKARQKQLAKQEEANKQVGPVAQLSSLSPSER